MNALKVTLAALALSCLLVACGGGDTSRADLNVFSQAHPVASNADPMAAMAVPKPRQAATVRTPDASSFLNWAESAYPIYFPGAQANKTLDVWTYRYYPQTDIFLGTNTSGDVLGLRGTGFGIYESIPLGKIADYGCSVYPSDCAAVTKCTPPLVPLGNICADPAAVAELAALDSLLRPVPETFWTSASIGGGGSGDGGGGDGSAGDGAPIANAPVVLTDNAGHTATTTTDAKGYYRINLTGFTPPFIVKVTRPDGTVWYSGSTQAPTKRGFVTMNLTGLTDKTVGYVADVANVSGGAEKVTPQTLASNPTALQVAKTRISTSLTSPLTYVGLNPSAFDPVASRYEAIKTDNYDRLLERLIMSKASGNTVVVGTFAGVRESFVDGAGTAASFSAMTGVAVDSSGNVFVADTENHAIRKISPAGVVSTFAGSGSYGLTNGVGSAASFYWPRGVAVDGSGNVFVADAGNHAIRKITPAGLVSTFAGGLPGFADGGTVTTLESPRGVAVDSSGNVFVAETYRNAILKITPAGVVSTLAGGGLGGFTNGIGTVARFYDPRGVAVDRSGNVFVADRGNNVIRKITPVGLVSTLAGSGLDGYANGNTNGLGTAAGFWEPEGVAVDSSGNVFVADTQDNTIRKITPAGLVSTFASNGYSPFGGVIDKSVAFNHPRGVAVDGSGNVFVADTENNVIRKITSAGLVATFAGSGSSGFGNGAGTAARFDAPTCVAVDGSGNVLVADSYNNAIRKITPAGLVSTYAGGLAPWAADSFREPRGVAVDSGGNVYVADTLNKAIRKVTPAGVVSTLASGFAYPMGVAVDGSGNVFVADTENHAIRKISPAGVVSTLAGGGIGKLTNGVGTAASFQFPRGLAVDSSGNVFVADTENNAIRRITPAGVVSTLAGGFQGGFNGFANGTGTAASFNAPTGVAVDSRGNVFVADTSNNAIRKITPAGVVSTLSGDGMSGYRNNTGTGARFASPSGVGVDSNGNVYVADTNNNAIRLILP